jgi:hypothetical protein
MPDRDQSIEDKILSSTKSSADERDEGLKEAVRAGMNAAYSQGQRDEARRHAENAEGSRISRRGLLLGVAGLAGGVAAVSYLEDDQIDIGEALSRDAFDYSIEDDDDILDLAQFYSDSVENEIRELGYQMFREYMSDHNILNFYLGFDHDAERVQMFGEDILMLDYVFDHAEAYKQAVDEAEFRS